MKKNTRKDKKNCLSSCICPYIDLTKKTLVMFNIKKIGKNHTLPYYYIIYSFTCYTSDIFNYPKKNFIQFSISHTYKNIGITQG